MTPTRPRLTLRMGFAGRKDLDAAAERHLRAQLKSVLDSIGHTLASIAPGIPVDAGREPAIAQFYASQAPLLRLVTGLCEGADALAAEVLNELQVCPDPGAEAADPDLAQTPAAAKAETHHASAPEPDIKLLQAYFQPDAKQGLLSRWGASARKRIWGVLERRYSTGPNPQPDPELEPYAAYRKRATALNYHYSGQYRGAFVLNYTLAVIAVALATSSLMLLGLASHTPIGEQLLALVPEPQQAGMVSNTPKPWLLPTLIVLALTKLGLVVYISRSTHRANHERWNDRAVDMRFLAERLRALYYLPRLGSFQPPAVHPPQFAARVVRQSHIDWLCEAIVRSVSPADLPQALPHNLQRPGQPDLPIRKLLQVDAAAELERIRDAWVAQQAVYHDRNAHGMHGMHHDMERWQQRLSSFVVGIVVADLLLIGAKLAHKLHWISLPPLALDIAKYATPALILLSALIPAIVAALGGLRFQSECQRLAERSSVMRRLLAGNAPLDAYSQSGQPTPDSQVGSQAGSEVGSAAGREAGREAGGETGGKTGSQGSSQAGSPDTPVAALADARGRLRQVDQQLQKIRTQQANPNNPASHAHLALRCAEAVAEEMIQEAAEWSVLYAKELGEPG